MHKEYGISNESLYYIMEVYKYNNNNNNRYINY